ncbi:FecR family protein [Gluconacetobacter sp. Hr-1-5]|uniref:FecR family protein n=1 Tax=Gluconacetobacter sp. Hr-1-5 TaxID=3395370 RepID=UPI003B51A002
MKDGSEAGRIRDDAALWIARLHADDCTDEDRARFLHWLHADAAHARAFEILTDLWEMGGGISLPVPPAVVARRLPMPALSRRYAMAVAVCGVAGLVVPLAPAANARRILRTRVGETRDFALDGGAVCRLDTDSRVTLFPERRQGILDGGQVFMDWRAAYPFAFRAGPLVLRFFSRAEVDMREEAALTGVTAVSGRVMVQAPQHGRAMWLGQGERLRILAGGRLEHDRPDLDELLAWRRGNLVFRDGRLADIVAEINRYTTRKIVLSTPRLAGMRLSGVYNFGKERDFLEILSRLLPLGVVVDPSGYRLIPV